MIRALLVLLSVGLWAASAHAETSAASHLEARSSRYDVEWSGFSLGEGTISLKPLEGNCYRYVSTTDPIALVRWTFGSPREESAFCLEGDQVRPVTFRYVNERREKDSFSLDFDWRAGTVKTLKQGEMTIRELPETAYDRFVIREAIRLWVIRHFEGSAPGEAEFLLVNDDKMKSYRFAVVPGQQISTPAGSFETVRVDRIDDPRRKAHYWLAPELDYLPVKLEQYKKDKLELRMTMLSTGPLKSR